MYMDTSFNIDDKIFKTLPKMGLFVISNFPTSLRVNPSPFQNFNMPPPNDYATYYNIKFS